MKNEILKIRKKFAVQTLNHHQKSKIKHTAKELNILEQTSERRTG